MRATLLFTVLSACSLGAGGPAADGGKLRGTENPASAPAAWTVVDCEEDDFSFDREFAFWPSPPTVEIGGGTYPISNAHRVIVEGDRWTVWLYARCEDNRYYECARGTFRLVEYRFERMDGAMQETFYNVPTTAAEAERTDVETHGYRCHRIATKEALMAPRLPRSGTGPPTHFPDPKPTDTPMLE